MSNEQGGCGEDKNVNDKASQQMIEEMQLKENLEPIKNKIVVLSGKGGVGKSTVATNLAVALAKQGASVGLLDIDIHGPSVPKLLGLEGQKLNSNAANRIIPVEYSGGIKVVSIGFMLPTDRDPVIWRGPLKFSVIRQFLKDVEWGPLDYLVIDSPPGTGDEPLSVCQLIENATGAVVVTTPQDVALADVKRSISFCESVKMPVIGVVENMSGFVCPNCGERVDIFKAGGGEKLAEEMQVPFLGSIPLNPAVTLRGDSGNPVVLGGDQEDDEVLVKSFNEILESLKQRIASK